MSQSDYKCKKCGHVREIWKRSIRDNFPKHVKCLKCDGSCVRVFSPAYTICHQGKAGNSRNGYSSTGGNIKKS